MMNMAGQKLGEFFVRQGIKVGGKAGGKAVKEGIKAATSEGVKQAGKRALRDTLLYTAAEQAIPRALGQDAPDIRDTLVRQASGNVLAEGVTAGLKGRSFFGEKGMKAGTARKIGEVTGQIGGQAFAQAVLPGKQANPFIPSTYMQDGVPTAAYGDLEDRYMGGQMSPQQEKQFETLDSQLFGEGPKTATGATKYTGEPEYNEVVRPSTTDLSGVQAREALSERERYEYRLKLAQAEKMPSPVIHMSPDSTQQSLNSLAQSMMRSTSY
jgi:hypothetical protein